MSIEERIADAIRMTEPNTREGCNPIIRDTQRAQIHIFKTAPRELPKLKMEIAIKNKAFNNCNTFPRRDILRAEIEALERLKAILTIAKEKS